MTRVVVTLRAPTRGSRQGFDAGVVIENDTVIRAAPIVKFMRGWSADQLRRYCREVGWEALVSKQDP